MNERISTPRNLEKLQHLCSSSSNMVSFFHARRAQNVLESETESNYYIQIKTVTKCYAI